MDVDFGPLTPLIGSWKGDKGLDIAPDPDGIEENPFYETIEFTAVGDVKNAEEQVLSVVRYIQKVYRKRDDKHFHDQTGYWLWDPATDEVIHSFTIPRGVCVLAGGKATDSSDKSVEIEVKASIDDPNYSIIQAPFMSQKAKTTGFEMTLSVKDEVLYYKETTHVNIYGNKDFKHVDENRLTKA